MSQSLISKAASLMGRKGGKAGTGKAKRRSAAHYRRLVAIRKAKRVSTQHKESK